MFVKYTGYAVEEDSVLISADYSIFAKYKSITFYLHDYNP